MKKITVERTASEGIVIGTVYLVQKEIIRANTFSIEEKDIHRELEIFEHAVKTVSAEIQEQAKENAIFAAHLELVNDFALHDMVKEKITSELKNAEWALAESADSYIAIFDAMEDEYMRERGADIRDIRERLLCEMQGVKTHSFEQIKEPVILVAEDLAPSDTAKLDLELIMGFITRDGGVTSHVSIMAKNNAIPALVGVKEILEEVRNGDKLIMDAKAGVIIINPELEQVEDYVNRRKEQTEEMLLYKDVMSLPPVEKDGRIIQVCANVGNFAEAENAVKCGIHGIGLFRSEFLYMENTHFPTEEEQYEEYKKAALAATEELTIRTLDIGGDKGLKYFTFDKEENPFLGWRAIRISLDMEDMFKTQLRAILRASAFGHVRIMFPMIISMEELIRAKELVEVCKNELSNEEIAFDAAIPVGMMMETPASVIMAEEFAKEADFFSIGTNDLTQYILAVDRGNTKIATRYDSMNPAVLKSIQMIIDAGHAQHIKVGMCGEMASDEKAIPVLYEMGLDEFSVSASLGAKVKYQLLQLSRK